MSRKIMKKQYRQTILFTALLLLGIVYLRMPSMVRAQNGASSSFDLSVSPPTAYLKIKPGNVAVHTITLKNNGTTALTVQPSLVSFTGDGETGKPVLSTTLDFPYLDLDKTSLDSLKLPPGATAQLTLHFSIPATAENKEYPLTILFKASDTNGQAATEFLTPVSGTIGSNLIILISDTGLLENLFSVEKYSKKNFIDSFNKLEFTPVLRNNSYASAVSSGSATISNWRGQKIAEYEIAPSVILGYSSRQIEPLSSIENANTGESIRTFEYDSPFLIGPYSLSLFLPSGDPENPVMVEHKTIVWAIPFALLTAVVFASFALAGYYFNKKKSKSALI